jgi:hypothetical protein
MSFSVALDTTARYERSLWRIWPASEPAVPYTANSIDYLSRFQTLVEEWRFATAASSRMRDKINHVAFREIVNMGEVAVPMIIYELTQRPDFLFLALNEIKRDVDLGLSGTARTPRNMLSAWLAWAERNNVVAD